jgi:hypothetical protein
MFHLRKMSADNTTPMTINTLSSSAFKNMYMIAEIIVFSITTFYFYRKINSLTYQLKEMDTKIQQLEKTIAEQKTFINDKMAEMSSIVSNMLRQSRQPVYTQQPVQTVYTPVQQAVYTPPQTSVQVQHNVSPPSPPRSNIQNTQQTPDTSPVQYAPPPVQSQTASPQTTQQQTVYAPPQPTQQQTIYTPAQPPVQPQQVYTPPQPSTPIVFPFELIVVGSAETPTASTNNTNSTKNKMTIEEDDDDELDKELSAELSELNE